MTFHQGTRAGEAMVDEKNVTDFFVMSNEFSSILKPLCNGSKKGA